MQIPHKLLLLATSWLGGGVFAAAAAVVVVEIGGYEIGTLASPCCGWMMTMMRVFSLEARRVDAQSKSLSLPFVMRSSLFAFPPHKATIHY